MTSPVDRLDYVIAGEKKTNLNYFFPFFVYVQTHRRRNILEIHHDEAHLPEQSHQIHFVLVAAISILRLRTEL